MNNHDELLKGIKQLFDKIFDSAEADETILCRAAIRKFGQMPQVIKACEELAELQQALAKWFVWKYTGCKGGTKMGVGCPEYILLFRKLPTDTSKAYADERVEKTKEEYTRAQWQLDAHGYWRSSGNRMLSKDEIMAMPVDKLQAAYTRYSRGNVYDYAEHVALTKKLDANGKLPATFMVAAPGSWHDDVWDDINRMVTLNTTQSQRRRQMHVCPLQIDIVDRIINRYSNPGDLVLDPFGGLGTVALRAILSGRRGYTIELNDGYFRDAVGYLKGAEAEIGQPTLFDFLEGA